MKRSRRLFLVAYDVTDDYRRLRISKILESFGYRIQYSVFLVEIGRARQVRMMERLYSKVAVEDSIIICDLGPISKSHKTSLPIMQLGRNVMPNTSDAFVV